MRSIAKPPFQLTLILLAQLLLSGCQLLQRADALGIGIADSADGSSYRGLKSAAPAAGGLNDAGSQQSVGKFLPDGISRADKLRAFLECRKECIAKCDRLVYVYSTKKEFCHDCIRQCMVAVLQQAKSLGIEFSTQEERMLGDSPSAASSAEDRAEERRRRRRRNRKMGKKDGKNRRQRRLQKEQQKLLKNCIVH